MPLELGGFMETKNDFPEKMIQEKEKNEQKRCGQVAENSTFRGLGS